MKVVVCLCAMAFAYASPVMAAVPYPTSTATDSRVELTFVRGVSTRVPWVIVRIGRCELRMILDTGAVRTTIDESSAKRCGLTLTTVGPRELPGKGVIQYSKTELHELRIGPTLYDNVSVNVFDMGPTLEPFRTSDAVHYDGCLGSDLFDRGAARFDFRTSRLSLHDPAAVTRGVIQGVWIESLGGEGSTQPPAIPHRLTIDGDDLILRTPGRSDTARARIRHATDRRHDWSAVCGDGVRFAGRYDPTTASVELTFSDTGGGRRVVRLHRLRPGADLLSQVVRALHPPTAVDVLFPLDGIYRCGPWRYTPQRDGSLVVAAENGAVTIRYGPGDRIRISTDGAVLEGPLGLGK